mgnify:CR=1 FL=1
MTSLYLVSLLAVVGAADAESAPEQRAIAYLAAEVLPYRPDAWIDHYKVKVGYEIPFSRHFYEYEPPRALKVIEGEIADLEQFVKHALNGACGSPMDPDAQVL